MSSHPSVLLMGDTLNFGGTEGQFVEVACGLPSARWDVDVACMRAEGPLRPRLEAAGLRPWSYGRGSLRSPRFIGGVRALARHLRERRVQIVHCFDFYSNVMGVPAARLAGVPVVIATGKLQGDQIVGVDCITEKEQAELKNKLSAYLRAVRRGRTLTVLDRDTPVELAFDQVSKA